MHSVEEIKNGVYWMGCNDFLTPLFERIFPIPDGVTRSLLMMKRLVYSTLWIRFAVMNSWKM